MTCRSSATASSRCLYLSAFLLYTAISLATTLAPFYFQGAMGYTASEVGYISMVVPLFMMFAAPASGGIYDRRHWKHQAAAGLIVYAAGMIVMSCGVLAMNFWLIIVAFAIRGIGAGIFSSPNGIETMSAVAREKLAYRVERAVYGQLHGDHDRRGRFRRSSSP